MKRKLIWLMFIVFLTSGCSIEYNLSIDSENNLEENFNIEVYASNDMSLDDLYYLYTEEYPIYNDEEFMYYDPLNKNEDYTYYNKNYQSINNGYLFSYQANMSFEDYNRARSVNTAYTNFSRGYIEDEECYYLSVQNTNLFTYNANLESITVTITFEDATVISDNASFVNGNTYTWVINRDSDENINIRYRLDKEIEEPTIPDENNPVTPDNPTVIEENSIFDYILLGAILLLFLIGIFGLIKYKSVSSKD